MDNLLKFAEQFVSLAKESKGKRGRKPKKVRNRKDIEKDLAFAKKRYSKSKTDVDSIKDQIVTLNSQLEQASSDMNSARDTMVNSHKVMKGMDLSGASMVQGDNDDVSYVIDKKRYDISFAADGSFELVPATSKKNKSDDKPDDKEIDDSLDADDDAYDDSDDMDDSDDINWVKDFESLFKS